MNKKIISTSAAVSLYFYLFCPAVLACTNFLVSKGASADSSTMITYAADSHVLYGELYYTPAMTHAPGKMLTIYEWDTGKRLGQIPEVPRTYSVVGNINEYQVAIGETTWGGRKELKDPKAIMDYGSLMYIALQRAQTAREAILIMGDLVAKYGYYSSGESLSISDSLEVWIMDIISKGPDDKGAVWVARRVPDGYVTAHANQARINKFPLNNKKNTLYAKDVISFARKKGYFKGKDKDFSFAAAYAPMDFTGLRICEARVWSFFRRIAPSLKLSPDYAMGVEGAKPMPLWIKPDKKLSVHDVIELMRDHFEDSPMDLTKGVGAGPYNLPYRWRPLIWEMDGKKYFNERSTSTQQTGFSFVTQSRSWMPNPIGGILWFSVDDTFSTVYVPMYCGIRKISKPYAVGTGDFNTFTWDSAFWVFNFVSNWAYTRYVDIIKDIQVVQRELEGGFFARQPEIEKAAMNLYKTAPELARDYLGNYSAKQGEMVTDRFRKLGLELLVKYLDGNVRDELGKVTHPGYPKHWYKRIIKNRGKHYEMRRIKGEPAPAPEEDKKKGCPKQVCPPCPKQPATTQ
ncbi:MAG: C69 family dipeptidase [Deltaproteobacteria bacterium]|nr:C69 family dipeptidase [Deltaproteobacteria bacterium]